MAFLRQQSATASSRIVIEARKLFLRLGYERARTRVIARNARTTESSLVRFYDDKFGVLCAAHALSWEETYRHVESTLIKLPQGEASVLLLEAIKAVWALYDSDMRDVVMFAICHCNASDTLVQRRQRV